MKNMINVCKCIWSIKRFSSKKVKKDYVGLMVKIWKYKVITFNVENHKFEVDFYRFKLIFIKFY